LLTTRLILANRRGNTTRPTIRATG
jgi:hypothetical protein